jgi:hypothetical protein
MEQVLEGFVCLDCGQMIHLQNFQNDDVKYIEKNGKTKY